MRKLLFSIGLTMLLAAFSSCSDKDITATDIDTPVPVGPSGYQQIAYMGDGTLQRLKVVDGLFGDLADITCSASWLTVKQDGQDGEQRPVIQLTADGECDEDRTATVTLTSKDNKKVSILVEQYALSGANSGEERLPEVTTLNAKFYENWFEGTDGNVYITVSDNKNTWHTVALPWADNAQGTVPQSICDEMRLRKHEWRLVYSTLGIEKTSGGNFFVLLNTNQQKLRFFYYIPAGYIANTTSVTFNLKVYNSNGKISMALNGNELLEMPDALQNSGKITLDNNYSNDGQKIDLVQIGTVNTSGWTCFDAKVDHGYTDVSKEALEDPETILTLTPGTKTVASIQTELVDVVTTGGIKFDNVSIVRKGSALQAAATFFNGLGSNIFSIGTGVGNILSLEDKKKCAGGVLQIVGGGIGLVGTCLNTAAAARDSEQNFKGEATVNFKTTGKLNGKITYDYISAMPALSFKPSAFKYDWSSLLDNPKKWKAGSTRADNDTLPTYGLINLMKNPVVYVSEDHLLYSPAKYPAHYVVDYNGDLIHCDTGDDEQLRYISFLDPSSIEVFINKESMDFKFDYAEISTSLFVNSAPTEQYTGPNPYVTYYQLKNDDIRITTNDGSDSFLRLFSEEDKQSMKLVACKNEEIPTVELAAGNESLCSFAMSELACKDSTITSLEDGFKYRYYGLTGSLFNGAKRIVVDPIIYVPTDKTQKFFFNKSKLGPVFMSLCARLVNTTDKENKNPMLIIMKQFKPEIRTFKASEISEIRSRIEKYQPTTVKTNKGTATAEFIDTQWLRERAYKMLELAGK